MRGFGSPDQSVRAKHQRVRMEKKLLKPKIKQQLIKIHLILWSQKVVLLPQRLKSYAVRYSKKLKSKLLGRLSCAYEMNSNFMRSKRRFSNIVAKSLVKRMYVVPKNSNKWSILGSIWTITILQRLGTLKMNVRRDWANLKVRKKEKVKLLSRIKKASMMMRTTNQIRNKIKKERGKVKNKSASNKKITQKMSMMMSMMRSTILKIMILKTMMGKVEGNAKGRGTRDINFQTKTPCFKRMIV